MTYNIHKGIGGGDRRYSLDRVLGVVAAETPDLLCLQEVARAARRARMEDQALFLARAAGTPHHLYQLNVRWTEGGYGNLLLSRWPFAEHHQVSLAFGDKKPRGGQIAVVETPAGRLLVANWHLGLGAQERRWQVRRLLSHPAFLRGKSLPTVLAGDANDWKNLLAWDPLAIHGFLQVTAPPSRFRSFPAAVPMGALDKIFCRGGISVESVRVVRTRLARAASDHLPVVMDFRLG